MFDCVSTKANFFWMILLFNFDDDRILVESSECCAQVCPCSSSHAQRLNPAEEKVALLGRVAA